jgi:hypothetical protein
MDKLEELQKKHPGKAIARIKSQGREFYVGAPTREHWHQFLDAFGDARRSRTAMENLAKKCALSPAADELDTLFEKKPGLAAKLSEAIGRLAGVDDDAEIQLFDAG